jgi:nucleotide-binding universal stress UspA family protein
MRSILCPIDNSPTREDRVQTALALARAVKGHVTFQVATPFAQIAMWEPFGGAALSAEAMNQARAADEKLAADLDARLGREDVPCDVEIVDEGPVEGIAAASRFADVIVASLEDPSLEEFGLGVRCPVLAVPKGNPMLVFDGPAMVAWDGGHEAAAALRAALPLLRMASVVHVVTVREKSADFPASDAASYLSRHDIHAECHEVERNHSIGFTLEEMSRSLNAGLVVMGLFGKSRLRELLLGGVSRDLLDRSMVPLLLAH